MLLVYGVSSKETNNCGCDWLEDKSGTALVPTDNIITTVTPDMCGDMRKWKILKPLNKLLNKDCRWHKNDYTLSLKQFFDSAEVIHGFLLSW